MILVREHRQSFVVRAVSCLSCLSFVFLLSAMMVPMFVVTSLKGEANLLVAHVSVDLNIGAGLFTRNVCYGRTIPEESVLVQFGLSCKGANQLRGCDNEDTLSQYQHKHCNDFKELQALEYTALSSLFFASVLGSLSSNAWLGHWALTRFLARLGALFFSFVALVASAKVLQKVPNTDMVDFDPEKNHGWDCVNVLGADLCHGYGSSFYLQAMATLFLVGVVLGNFLMGVCFGGGSSSTTFQVVREPLLHHGTTPGYVISRPAATVTVLQEA